MIKMIHTKGELLEKLDHLQQELQEVREAIEKSDLYEDEELFWESFGSWEDTKSVEELIDEIYKSRKSRSHPVEM